MTMTVEEVDAKYREKVLSAYDLEEAPSIEVRGTVYPDVMPGDWADPEHAMTTLEPETLADELPEFASGLRGVPGSWWTEHREWQKARATKAKGMRHGGVRYDNALREALLAEQDRICPVCLREIGRFDRVHLDRHVPGMYGGLYLPHNCQAMHGHCNASKGVDTPWMTLAERKYISARLAILGMRAPDLIWQHAGWGVIRWLIPEALGKNEEPPAPGLRMGAAMHWQQLGIVDRIIDHGDGTCGYELSAGLSAHLEPFWEVMEAGMLEGGYGRLAKAAANNWARGDEPQYPDAKEVKTARKRIKRAKRAASAGPSPFSIDTWVGYVTKGSKQNAPS